MRYFSPLLLVFSLLALAARAQSVAYGDWQLHLPANHPRTLANAGDRLYVADESSFYYYDKVLSTTQRLSRRDGLSDVSVSAVAYDSTRRQVIIAYQNGNIDLLRADGSVKNITDVLRKTTSLSKAVSEIQVYNGVAYLASSLGLIVLDLDKFEVRDTYSAIGAGGQTVTVSGTAIVHDTIFASTSAGVLRGRISPTVNLLDYRNWTKELPNPGSPNDNLAQLLAYRGHVYGMGSFRGVYCLSGVGAARGWRTLPNSYGNEARRLRISSAGGLLFSFRDTDLRYTNRAVSSVSLLLPKAAIGTNAFDMVYDTDGTVYVASYERGLLRFAPGSPTPEVIRPNAPATAADYSVLADAATNSVTVFSGGYSADNGLQNGNRGGFYQYQDGRWTNYTRENYSATDFPNLLDLSRGTRTADGTLYVASYGNGLLQWQGPGKFRQFTYGQPRVPLRGSLDPEATALDYVRVTDVTADPGGKYVWVTNRHQRSRVPGLLRYQPGADAWTAAPWFPGSDNLDRAVIDNYGNPWVIEFRGGVSVYDTTSHQALAFATGTGTTGGINRVFSITRDRTGSIWLGTDDGVSFFSEPSQVITYLSGTSSLTGPGGFATPVVRRGTGSGYPALFNTAVRCMAVDGANRKWFGTPSGLWLFSPNADEALLHFTTANSPLPSNSIIDLAVNDKTGEVFVATDGGLVSYQGSASITEGSPSCADVYPNPVQADFTGVVGIRGLVNNAYVKITDVAGHLVYSTRANGGTVTWDLNDAQGRRVRSGVYLVLTSDADGKNGCVSKVAVLSK